jgi:hypothetical protein
MVCDHAAPEVAVADVTGVEVGEDCGTVEDGVAFVKVASGVGVRIGDDTIAVGAGAVGDVRSQPMRSVSTVSPSAARAIAVPSGKYPRSPRIHLPP